MQALDAYPLPPGCCALCRGTAVPLVDTNLNTEDMPVEFNVAQSGWVYVCRQCVFHMANLLGAPSPEEHNKVRARLAEVEEAYARTRDRLRHSEAAVDALSRIRTEEEARVS